MKIIIHRDKRTGAGQCVAAAPELFDQDPEEGLVILTGALATAILYLCSGAARTVNGHVLAIDGGYVAT